jgi:hypothetical protein
MMLVMLMIAEFDNCDLSDHRREGTHVQNRRNVQEAQLRVAPHPTVLSLCASTRDSFVTNSIVRIPRFNSSISTSLVVSCVSSRVPPISLANLSIVNLVSIFRCSSSTVNPVYPRRVTSLVLVCSLSSHRHSYIDFIFRSRFIDS